MPAAAVVRHGREVRLRRAAEVIIINPFGENIFVAAHGGEQKRARAAVSVSLRKCVDVVHGLEHAVRQVAGQPLGDANAHILLALGAACDLLGLFRK